MQCLAQEIIHMNYDISYFPGCMIFLHSTSFYFSNNYFLIQLKSFSRIISNVALEYRLGYKQAYLNKLTRLSLKMPKLKLRFILAPTLIMTFGVFMNFFCKKTTLI